MRNSIYAVIFILLGAVSLFVAGCPGSSYPNNPYGYATNTPTPAGPTPTFTLTTTSTSTSSPTKTATSTLTGTPTSTVTTTATPTITSTPTLTATPTITSTPTLTLTDTSTSSPTNTATITDTPTITYTHTQTSTSTVTSTPTNTATAGAAVTIMVTTGSNPSAAHSFSYFCTGATTNSDQSIVISAHVNDTIIIPSSTGFHPLYFYDAGAATCVIGGTSNSPLTYTFSAPTTCYFHCGNHGATCSPLSDCTQTNCTAMAGVVTVQ